MRVTLLVLLVVASGGAGVAADPLSVQGLNIDLDVGKDEWIAIRFNLSAGDDLGAHGMLWSCHASENDFETSISQVWFGIIDGVVRPYPGALAVGSSLWTSGTDSAEVGISGTKLRLPPGYSGASGGCQGLGGGYGQGLAAQRSVTLVAVSSAPESRLEFSASWTRGVDSVDVRTGRGILLTKNDFEAGAHANVYPAGVAGGAGVFLQQTETSTHDTIGYYLPELTLFSAGLTTWTCRENGMDCPPPDIVGYIPLSSKSTTDWEFEITLDARLEGPYDVLALLDLRTDDYLD